MMTGKIERETWIARLGFVMLKDPAVGMDFLQLAPSKKEDFL